MASRVAVQMLVGKNEEPFLAPAIESVAWADYITVTNTDPQSYWGEINYKIVKDTCSALDFELRYDTILPDEEGHFSFSEARNTCLSNTDRDDYVFIVDADDVHYPYWEDSVHAYIQKGCDSITAHYYHLMVYKDIFQFVAPREIIYRNYSDTEWTSGVHEQLMNKKNWPVVSDYHYIHYGYIKPQTQIFERWKFYSDIVGDYHHYDGQDPNNIVSDRVTVSKPLPIEHPPAAIELLESYPPCPEGALKENWETVPVEKTGLVLLTYNDADNLKQCLETLSRTHTYPNFEVLAIDFGSTDESLALLDSYTELIEMQVFEVGELIPLAEALNFGFNQFRQRHDIQYIGWIHPDCTYPSDWLYHLYQDLQTHPKIGKICAANTREYIDEDRPGCPPVTELTEGQEQIYIIRKEIVNKIGLFDEGYRGIGGWEDHDYNRRIINHDGYKVMISPRSKVRHEGMATRRRRDTTKEQLFNANYYYQKWGTSNPPC